MAARRAATAIHPVARVNIAQVRAVQSPHCVIQVPCAGSTYIHGEGPFFQNRRVRSMPNALAARSEKGQSRRLTMSKPLPLFPDNGQRTDTTDVSNVPTIGIGGASRLLPSHTTVRTGPYTAVREVTLTRFDQMIRRVSLGVRLIRRQERFDVFPPACRASPFGADEKSSLNWMFSRLSLSRSCPTCLSSRSGLQPSFPVRLSVVSAFRHGVPH